MKKRIIENHVKRVVRWKNIKNIEEMIQRKENDMVHDVVTKDDMTAYLAT